MPSHLFATAQKPTTWFVDEWQTKSSICNIPGPLTPDNAATLPFTSTALGICSGSEASESGVYTTSLNKVGQPRDNQVGTIRVWKDYDNYLSVTVSLDAFTNKNLSPNKTLQAYMQWAAGSSRTPSTDKYTLALGVVTRDGLRNLTGSDTNVVGVVIPYQYTNPFPFTNDWLSGRYTCATIRIPLFALCDPATSYYDPSVAVSEPSLVQTSCR